MKLVKLDDDVWVNPEHVTVVERAIPNGTIVRVTATDVYLEVDADVYEVLERLDPASEPSAASAAPHGSLRRYMAGCRCSACCPREGDVA